MMQSFLSKGVSTYQKVFERVADEAKASVEKKKLLENENRKLWKENERLKEQSHQLKDQSTKQQTAIDALKQELEKSLQCYEECRTELKDMVTLYDAQQIQLEANANLIAELKRLKGELEDTLEKNETYCHQWGAYLATAYRRALESLGAETQDFKIMDNISSFVEWLHSKLKVLPDTMSKVGDYGGSDVLPNSTASFGTTRLRAFQGFRKP
jgi:chromosome segregation ATPase